MRGSGGCPEVGPIIARALVRKVSTTSQDAKKRRRCRHPRAFGRPERPQDSHPVSDEPGYIEVMRQSISPAARRYVGPQSRRGRLAAISESVCAPCPTRAGRSLAPESLVRAEVSLSLAEIE